ncbi:MAG TPA: response regulator [Bacteriovoracaceae bacterium]|nr:response regulator [Bacteriovoracaceae bacterium]
MDRKNFEVVVIDDDLELLDVMRFNLEEEFTVRTFTDPVAALSYLDGHTSDAIVMDYYMGKWRAPQVYQELKSKKHDLPVLFLTGDHDLTLKIDCLGMGVADVLHKPISTAELTAHIYKRIISHRRKNSDMLRMVDGL